MHSCYYLLWFLVPVRQVLGFPLAAPASEGQQRYGLRSKLPSTKMVNGLLATSSQKDNDSDSNDRSLSFEDTDAASKGIVLSLTSFVNSVISPLSNPTNKVNGVNNTSLTMDEQPPTSQQDLLKRIRSDYMDRNYLWTGNIDLACFDDDCRFQDPTISFVGRDQFVTNVQNLQPFIDALVTEEQSILLDIALNEKEGYVQTRWNMVGSFTGLFWKPRLDVVGRTKFWFKKSNKNEDDFFSVYFYDEEWEIPAYRALLQLLVPGK